MDVICPPKFTQKLSSNTFNMQSRINIQKYIFLNSQGRKHYLYSYELHNYTSIVTLQHEDRILPYYFHKSDVQQFVSGCCLF